MSRILIATASLARLAATRSFLEGYARNVEDAREVPVHLVTTSDDVAAVRALAAEFPAVVLYAHAVEELIPGADGALPFAVARDVNRGTFEALSRLYALAALDYDEALVLDGDALVIKPCRIGDAFDTFFARRCVRYSEAALWGPHWSGSVADAVADAATRLVGAPAEPVSFVESRAQFYEKRVITDLIAAIGGDPWTALRALPPASRRLSEAQLVWSFVLARREAYGYQFASTAELLGRYLDADACAEYMRGVVAAAPVGGLLEAAGLGMTERTAPGLTRLFADEGVRFFRYDARNLNGDVQRALIDATPVAWLVASPAYARRRIAVCLSGMPRNVRQNVRFLRAFLAETDVDLFIHFWDTPERDYLVRALAPKGYEFEPTSAAPPPPVVTRLEKRAPAHRARDHVSMHYSIQRSNALRQAHERRHGFRYDVVVRYRLDLFSTETLADVLARIDALGAGWDRIVYCPDQMISAGLNDQVGLGSSETMDVYAGYLDALPDLVPGEWFHPEYLLLRHLLRAGLQVRAVPFEYALLRGELANTFDLPQRMAWIDEAWWAPPLPPIPPRALTTYLAAQADSASLIDALDLDMPRVYRVRSPSRGYLRLGSAGDDLAFTDDVRRAGLFFVTIPTDLNQTVVQIRPRELVVRSLLGARRRVGHGCFYPQADGRVWPGGLATEDSMFFVQRRAGGVLFEWRPGFWRSPADDRTPRWRPAGGRPVPLPEEAEPKPRLVLQPDEAGGLALAPLTEASEALVLEYVPDTAAEAAPLGLALDEDGAGVTERPRSLTMRSLNLAYRAARYIDDHGVRVAREKVRRVVRARTARHRSPT